MSDNSKIEWTDASWNPIRAIDLKTGKVGWHCEHATTGCEFCYAEGINKRLGTGLPFKPGHRERLNIALNEKTLLAPLRWKKPRMIFVCSMTDAFADFVTDEMLDKMFAVMALCPQHTFQVLTKRAERMRAYCSDPQTPFRVARAMDELAARRDIGLEEIRPIVGYPGYFASSHGFIYSERRGKRRRMSPDIGDQGHTRVQLYRGTSPKTADRLLVHRIILETFIGPPPAANSQGRHRDQVPTNNAASNLMWGDQAANWDDAKRHGSHRRYSKLTEGQASEIRIRHAAGEAGEALAREFDISATQIRNIASGKQWAVAAPIEWPLRNVWKGVSCERQQEADERVPLLLQTPAAVRFISAEPLLGAIDLTRIQVPRVYGSFLLDALKGAGRDHHGNPFPTGHDGRRFDWVIVGGESGPKARPMHPDWARSIRDQCQAAGVAFFFKQHGQFIPESCAARDHQGAHTSQTFGKSCVQQDGEVFWSVGKKAAGRLLDGRTHDEFPRRSA